jgi:hypothetical protein
MNPINQTFPSLNGIDPSWADIKFVFSVAGVPILGPAASALPIIDIEDIAAINTSRAVEVGYKEGATGGRRNGRSTGRESAEASITFWRSGFEKFCEILAMTAPRRGANEYAISLVHFDFSQFHTPFGSLKVFERRVQGCRVIGDTMNSQVSSDVQQVEVPLSTMKIIDVIAGKNLTLI